MTYKTYCRQNVVSQDCEQLPIPAHYAPPLTRMDALAMVNEWNRIASHCPVSQWRYWVE